MAAMPCCDAMLRCPSPHTGPQCAQARPANRLNYRPFGTRLWQRTGAGNPHTTKHEPPGTWFFVFITTGEYKEEPACGADGGYSTATLIPLAKPGVFVVPELAVEFHPEKAHY
jgi:hypothetical protein